MYMCDHTTKTLAAYIHPMSAENVETELTASGRECDNVPASVPCGRGAVRAIPSSLSDDGHFARAESLRPWKTELGELDRYIGAAHTLTQQRDRSINAAV